MKEKYYSNVEILKKEAQYNILIGERSNGKSYCIKVEQALKKAWKEKKCTFGLLKRMAEDIKGTFIEDYFSDAPVEKITKGEYNYICGYSGSIYFADLDDNGKVTRGLMCGKTFALSNDERYKSRSYPDITDLIFEEFITKNLYLRDEVNRLMSLVSTIFRRRDGRVWMIANTVGRVCPYFNEWGLRGIPTMQLGQIDTYDIKSESGTITRIAVEYCGNSDVKKSNMFFGNAAKHINSGAWETEVAPHLPEGDYDIIYNIGYAYNDFAFILNLCVQDGNMFVYVKPAARLKEGYRLPKRCLSQEFNPSRFVTNCFLQIKPEILMHDLINKNKICYSHNLCAADFNSCRKNANIIL